MTPIPIQRLRVPRPRLETVIEELDRSDSQYQGARSGVRRPCCRPGVLATREGTRQTGRHEVFVRNVSVTGSSVLHAVFLPTHAPCTLVLITDQREPIAADATVVRCHHVEGAIHELGLLFVEPLSETQAERLCVPSGSVALPDGDEATRLRAAMARCTELTEQVRRLIQDDAGAEEVLPLLDELSSLESLTRRAA